MRGEVRAGQYLGSIQAWGIWRVQAYFLRTHCVENSKIGPKRNVLHVAADLIAAGYICIPRLHPNGEVCGHEQWSGG